MDPDRDKDGFLTYIPVGWAPFVKWAARDTGLDVYATDEIEGRVAVYTNETCSTTPFWTRFRELKGD